MKKLIILIFIISTQIALCKWESIVHNLGNIDFQDFVIIDTKIYGASNTGIYVSANNGINWAKLNNGLELKFNLFPVFINSIDTTLFIAVLRNYSDGFIYMSDNYGINWSKINSLNKMPFYCLEVSDSNLITTSGIYGSFYTSNFGKSWDTLITNFTKKPINKLWAIDKYLFAYSSEGGFLSTNKGKNWFKISLNLGNYGDFIYYHDRIFVSDRDIYCSSDNGITWIKKEMPNTMEKDNITSFAFTENIIFAGGGYSLYVSTDFGDNWNRAPGIPNIRSLASNGGYLFAAATDGFSSRAKIIDLLPPVGVGDVIKSNNKVLSITPNPSSNQIKIRIKDDLSRFSNGKIEISSNIGENILNIAMNEGIYNQGIELDVSSFPPGVYYCTVRTGSFILTRPFVVIH